MSTSSPLILAVAPNGARLQKKDHPSVPLVADEIARAARDCVAVGANMLHLHVRDEYGQHSLAAAHYQESLQKLSKTIGNDMLIQVTSEAAGAYSTEEQIEHIRELWPDFLSMAIREFFRNEDTFLSACTLVEDLHAAGRWVQYIIYDEHDVLHYQRLIAKNIIPLMGHMLLFVIGRHNNKLNSTEEFVEHCQPKVPWMVCAFGDSAYQHLVRAAELGGHVRVGFENGFSLADGTIATTNAELVSNLVAEIRHSGRPLASQQQIHELFTSTA